jgi:hypothetical protein
VSGDVGDVQGELGVFLARRPTKEWWAPFEEYDDVRDAIQPA